MRIMVTGAQGQLGTDVVKALTAKGFSPIAADKDDFDITNESEVLTALRTHKPEAVINCAAYTAVDKAEDEPLLCRQVNVTGTKNIALACKDINAKMLHISTDYVFPGDGSHFYKPEDIKGPLSVYGTSKLEGEMALSEILERFFIVRISWLFGDNGGNFVKTMLKLSESRSSLDVVCDQIGSPTYTADLAVLLCEMVLSEKYGVYHATNEGVCSWADFAEEIFRIAGKDVKVNHIPSALYKTKALRPLNSRLDKVCLDTAGFGRLPTWQDALGRYLNF